ncbi:hypothetical protein J6590_018565 [Homalodisca vitripennis]|nr:hypothetical protein J6590_018565 [Homalodisca vitripennis]
MASHASSCTSLAALLTDSTVTYTDSEGHSPRVRGSAYTHSTLQLTVTVWTVDNMNSKMCLHSTSTTFVCHDTTSRERRYQYTARLLKTPIHCKITRGSYCADRRYPQLLCGQEIPVYCKITLEELLCGQEIPEIPVYCNITRGSYCADRRYRYTARLLEAAMRGQKTPVHCKITRGVLADRRHRYTARLLEAAIVRTENRYTARLLRGSIGGQKNR